jgi:predicted ATP-grasp superfamily ATP-dependent carboligase
MKSKIIKNKKEVMNSTFLISIPTKTNISNMLLGQILNKLNPVLVGKIEFNNVPIAIVNNNNINFPSVDIYFKKIKKKKFLFFIGNHIPQDIFGFSDFIMKLFKEFMGKNMVVLNEINTKKDEGMYLRIKKPDKKDDLDNLIKNHRFKPIRKCVISGFTALMLRKNIPLTALFIKKDGKKSFAANLELLANLLNIPKNKSMEIKMNDLFDIHDKIEGLKIDEEKQEKVTEFNVKLNYIG